MKTCTKCGRPKPLTDFYQTGPRCKACERLKAKEYKANNRERFRASKRAAYLQDREKRLQEKKEYVRRNPEKIKAQNALNNAIRDGRALRGACEVCGASRAHGHHHDYSRPLDVIWLCKAHHESLHEEKLRGNT